MPGSSVAAAYLAKFPKESISIAEEFKREPALKGAALLHPDQLQDPTLTALSFRLAFGC